MQGPVRAPFRGAVIIYLQQLDGVPEKAVFLLRDNQLDAAHLFQPGRLRAAAEGLQHADLQLPPGRPCRERLALTSPPEIEFAPRERDK